MKMDTNFGLTHPITIKEYCKDYKHNSMSLSYYTTLDYKAVPE